MLICIRKEKPLNWHQKLSCCLCCCCCCRCCHCCLPRLCLFNRQFIRPVLDSAMSSTKKWKRRWRRGTRADCFVSKWVKHRQPTRRSHCETVNCLTKSATELHSKTHPTQSFLHFSLPPFWPLGHLAHRFAFPRIAWGQIRGKELKKFAKQWEKKTTELKARVKGHPLLAKAYTAPSIL